MGIRRKSRELALQFLFSRDFQEHANTVEAVAADLELFCQLFDVNRKALEYGRHLILGICSNLATVDTLLAAHSHNWRVERMSLVDRNILRIAIFEMRYTDEAPAQVAINEALEIAKRYSVDDSVAFINGILDAVQAAPR
ncbi:transcription antitermination factor NusB [Desulfobulbus alkaliphilus]|uniref:transcription antitermination factor NusB n=1 Tax=Desulfobulbus alkaliphilus TaxID=869814 RepID=UPI001963AAFB|nr:transcription antitermination factor NusB [Desulfobulbus alkaliphilus]MBM9535931.1 transcription antitermination factor NusB [Desulfobulbus alkaliphilus]